MKDNGLDVPGKAMAKNKVPVDSAVRAVRRAEGKGASLIAQHWLEAFGALGDDWAGEDFVRRMRKQVLEVIDMEAFRLRPRKYEPYYQTCNGDWFDVQRKHGFRKRFHQSLACHFSADARTVSLSGEAFSSRTGIRRPRNCSHFRFFVAVGMLCDFEYSPESKRYVASRPDVLGLSAVTYSEMYLCGAMVRNGLQLSVGLPGDFVMDDQCQPVIAVGLEFWFFGKTAPEGRRVERVLIVR